ncbi:30S ribosomal protein S3 [Striga asiatica]|uniref:30S ribosomal protein S3 n=1 Tax=Striga asiatica TaxID=4170 RepID=A0A5A7PER8_STRAF|nr:30S ribosomal protein S3 [Striga asiatica]
MVNGRMMQKRVKEYKGRMSLRRRKKRNNRNNCMGPECQRCCCFLYASYDSGSSQRHCIKMVDYNKLRNIECHGYLINEFPTTQVCTDSNIHVLDSCSVQPSTTVLDGFNSPNTSCPIESEKVEEPPIDLLFNLEMKGQIYILQSCKQIFFLVDKSPPGLHQRKVIFSLQTYKRTSYLKVRNSVLQKIWCWLEIRIKDGYKLIILDIITTHCRSKVPCFISCPNKTMPVNDVHTSMLPFMYFCLNKGLNISIIRIIQNLYKHPLPGPILDTYSCNRLLYVAGDFIASQVPNKTSRGAYWSMDT